jgi:hypothetical protein
VEKEAREKDIGYSNGKVGKMLSGLKNSRKRVNGVKRYFCELIEQRKGKKVKEYFNQGKGDSRKREDRKEDKRQCKQKYGNIDGKGKLKVAKMLTKRKFMERIEKRLNIANRRK